MNGYGYSHNPSDYTSPYGHTPAGYTLTSFQSAGYSQDQVQKYQYPSPALSPTQPLNSSGPNNSYSTYQSQGYDSPFVQEGKNNQGQGPPDLSMLKQKRPAKGKGKVSGEAPTSKREARRQKIEAEHGTIGARDMPKGKTRMGPSGIDWWDEDERMWRPAAPLDDYRHEIIHLDNLFDRYDILPKHGMHSDDITSFTSAYGQQFWNLEDRSTWGNIRDTEGNTVMYLLGQPVREVEPVSSGWMTHNGLLMLDPDDMPINDWPGIPRCLSSQLEGARMEALRRIVPMTIPDFRARMPRKVQNKNGKGRDLFGLSTFNHRLLRFRRDYDCPAWASREKDAGLKKFTLERLAAEVSPSVSSPLVGSLSVRSQSLTTEGLTPPSKYEKERRKLVNAGKNPEKAGGRAITEKERESRAQKATKRLEKLQKQEEARENPSTAPTAGEQYTRRLYDGIGSDTQTPASNLPTKRGRDDSIDDEGLDQNSIQPPQKRVRRSPKTEVTLDPRLGAEQLNLFATSTKQVPKPQPIDQASAASNAMIALSTHVAEATHPSGFHGDHQLQSPVIKGFEQARPPQPSTNIASSNQTSEVMVEDEVSGRSQISSQSAAGPGFQTLNFGNVGSTDVGDFDLGLDRDASAPPAHASRQDLRYVRPCNLAEQVNIKAALLYTGLDYMRYHGEGPPATPADETYTEQYDRLETLHQHAWCRPGQAPPLLRVREWFGSFDQYLAPVLSEEVAERLLGIPANTLAAPSMDESTVTTEDKSITERAMHHATFLTGKIDESFQSQGHDIPALLGTADERNSEQQAAQSAWTPAMGTNDEVDNGNADDTILGEGDDQFFNDLFGADVLMEDDLNEVNDLPN